MVVYLICHDGEPMVCYHEYDPFAFKFTSDVVSWPSECVWMIPGEAVED